MAFVSSTTIVTGVLKQSLKEDVHGISIVGGKGSKSTAAKNDILRLAEKHYNLSENLCTIHYI